jgi:hypothetical protein
MNPFKRSVAPRKTPHPAEVAATERIADIFVAHVNGCAACRIPLEPGWSKGA